MAYCSECGTDIGAAKFCSNCGASSAPKNVENKPTESPKNRPKEKQKEEELAQFTDGFKCDIRLSTERIYAKSVGLEETYALRSVDGIGVYDDLEKFKDDKLKAEQKAKSAISLANMLFVYAGLIGLGGLWALAESSLGGGIFLLILCGSVCVLRQ